MAFRVTFDELQELDIQRSIFLALRILFVAHSTHRAPQCFRVFTRGPAGHVFDEPRADEQLQLNILPRFDSLYQIAAPRFETIDPTFHGVSVPAHRQDWKFTAPAIIADGQHGRGLHDFVIFTPIQKLARDLVMAVGEHVCLDDDRLSDNALDRKTPAIDLRLNPLDDDTTPSVTLLFGHA
jgi:hypothetical protein